MPKQITQARAARKKPAPSWTKETPKAQDYYLLADEPNAPASSWVQFVPVKRSEFIALKAHLAKMRGYALTEVAHA